MRQGDIAINRWIAMPAMQHARYSEACVTLAPESDHVMILGGRLGPMSLSSVEIYDIQTNAWKSGVNMPESLWAS